MDAVLAAGGKWRLTGGGSVLAWLTEHIALSWPVGVSPRLALLFGRKCKPNQVFTVRADPD